MLRVIKMLFLLLNFRPPKNLGLVASGASPVTRGLELWVLPLDLWGGMIGWRLILITNGLCFNQSCLHNEASVELQKHAWWKVFRLVSDSTSTCHIVTRTEVYLGGGDLAPCFSLSGSLSISLNIFCNKLVI